MGAPILTLVAFGDTGNFSSGITLLHNINLYHWYLASSGMDNTYDLGVFSPCVDITVADCHRLTLEWCQLLGTGIMSSIFLLLGKTAPLLYGALVTAGWLF